SLLILCVCVCVCVCVCAWWVLIKALAALASGSLFCCCCCSLLKGCFTSCQVTREACWFFSGRGNTLSSTGSHRMCETKEARQRLSECVCVCVCVLEYHVDVTYNISVGHAMRLPCDDVENGESRNVMWRRKGGVPMDT